MGMDVNRLQQAQQAAQDQRTQRPPAPIGKNNFDAHSINPLSSLSSALNSMISKIRNTVTNLIAAGGFSSAAKNDLRPMLGAKPPSISDEKEAKTEPPVRERVSPPSMHSRRLVEAATKFYDTQAQSKINAAAKSITQKPTPQAKPPATSLGGIAGILRGKTPSSEQIETPTKQTEAPSKPQTPSSSEKIKSAEKQINKALTKCTKKGAEDLLLNGKVAKGFLFREAKVIELPSGMHKAYAVSYLGKDQDGNAVAKHAIFYMTDEGKFKDSSQSYDNMFQLLAAYSKPVTQ